MSCVTMTTVFRTRCWIAAKLRVQLCTRERIERAERLVHQQDRRIDRQRPRDPDPLALPARQLVRPAFRHRERAKPHEIQELIDPRRRPLGRPSFQARHDADIPGDVEMWKQTHLLQDETDASSQPDRFPLARVTPFDEHGASVGQQQAIDEFQERGFSGAAAADEREHV